MVEGSRNIHTLPHQPNPLSLSAHPHPDFQPPSETLRVGPTHSVPCGLDGSNQATMGDSAGASALSSSTSSSWEGSLFLQGHSHGGAFSEGRSHREKGANPDRCRSPRAEPWAGGEWGRGCWCHQRVLTCLHGEKEREGRDTVALWTSVSTSVQCPSVKVTTLTWYQANWILHPSPASH